MPQRFVVGGSEKVQVPADTCQRLGEATTIALMNEQKVERIAANRCIAPLDPHPGVVLWIGGIKGMLFALCSLFEICGPPHDIR